MAINSNPTFTPGQRIPAEVLKRWLDRAALGTMDPVPITESQNEVMQQPRTGWYDTSIGKMSPLILRDPRMANVGNGESTTWTPTGGYDTRIYQPRNDSTWGANNVADVWDEQGNYIGTDSGAADWRQVATIAAMAAGGAYAGSSATAGSQAAATAGTAGGMTGSELAAFLEANAGALAPGGEIAAGYGTTWGVGADGIIGAGATMTANGMPLSPNTTAPPTTANTPSTPNTPPPVKPTDFTLKDGVRLASDAVKVINSTTGGGGGGGGGGSMDNVDPRLLDAQLNSMDLQDQLLQRMISNADMIMPFQRDAMEFGLRTAREAYGDYRDDRQYALGRRGELTGLQDQAIRDAREFNTEAKREELAGLAIADVNRAFKSASDQAVRSMTRTGTNPNDGRWGSTIRQLITDQTLAQASAANGARRDARAEGRALVDRAAGMLSGAPSLAMGATGAGAGAGASGVPLAGQSLQAMQGGLNTAAGVAGQWGNNATNMAGLQARSGGGGGGTDWSAAGALLAGLTKAYDAFSK